jgi:hypothetical protein
VAALAERIGALWGDEEAGERGLAMVRATSAPEAIGAALRRVYDGVRAG